MSTYFTCMGCNKSFLSRPNLDNHALDRAKRVHCCGSIVCVQCSSSLGQFHCCPFCDSFFTTDGRLDYEIDSLQVILRRNRKRTVNGIPLNATLRPHPETLRQNTGPKWIEGQKAI